MTSTSLPSGVALSRLSSLSHRLECQSSSVFTVVICTCTLVNLYVAHGAQALASQHRSKAALTHRSSGRPLDALSPSPPLSSL